MSLRRRPRRPHPHGFPRASGDEPPRALAEAEDEVFPARAGMSRTPRRTSISRRCFPRASGDEPMAEELHDERTASSPRERG